MGSGGGGGCGGVGSGGGSGGGGGNGGGSHGRGSGVGCEGGDNIRSAKRDDNYGASNIVLPCPGSKVIFHLVKDVVIILKSYI
jgi:hypothetical protein